MKYIKLIISAALIQFTFTGCSYVSDYVEGRLTKRASFSIEAQQVGNDVVITWSKTDSSSDFAGIEISKTMNANNELSEYLVIADRSDDGTLASATTGTYTDLNASASPGVYFYRVAFIHWDDPVSERTSANGYIEPWDGASILTNYDNHTGIDTVSGSGRVDIN